VVCVCVCDACGTLQSSKSNSEDVFQSLGGSRLAVLTKN